MVWLMVAVLGRLSSSSSAAVTVMTSGLSQVVGVKTRNVGEVVTRLLSVGVTCGVTVTKAEGWVLSLTV